VSIRIQMSHPYIPTSYNLKASSVNAAYSSLLINFSSGSPETSNFAIQPSPSGFLLTGAGFSSNTLFTSVTLPPIGVRISEADFTDSTAPTASPAAISMSTGEARCRRYRQGIRRRIVRLQGRLFNIWISKYGLR